MEKSGPKVGQKLDRKCAEIGQKKKRNWNENRSKMDRKYTKMLYLPAPLLEKVVLKVFLQLWF